MDTKRRKSHHDRHADHLFDLIESNYLMILRNVQYKLPDRILGEIDILAIRKDEFDIYEVKCNGSENNLRRAIKQTKLARYYLGQQGREFVYTPKDGIKPVDEIVQQLRRKY